MSESLPHLDPSSGARVFLVFQVGAWKLALPFSEIERVLPVMEAVPLPGAPAVVAGVIRLKDRPIPVMDLRRHLGASLKKVELTDALLLVTTPIRQVALWVDQVEGLLSIAHEELVQANPLFGENRVVHEVSARKTGLILIYNLEEILSEQDETALAASLRILEEKD